MNKKIINNKKKKIEKTKQKIKIKISNIVTWVINLVMFNKFLCKNKFVIEKHIKFIEQ